jgi:hypothetical protein
MNVESVTVALLRIQKRRKEFEKKFHKPGPTDNSIRELYNNKTHFDFIDILHNHIRSRIPHPVTLNQLMVHALFH